MSLLSPIIRRPLTPQLPVSTTHLQTRHASLLRRPKRPYTFTQLVTLSDGSSYTHRTTSPAPVYKSNKDTRNTMLWNPSSQRLLNVEADEAGRLRAFRERFGRGWDAEKMDEEVEHNGEEGEDGEGGGEDNLMDLISRFGNEGEVGEGERGERGSEGSEGGRRGSRRVGGSDE